MVRRKVYAVGTALAMAGSIAGCGSASQTSSINTTKPTQINMLYANSQADSQALIAVLPQFEKKYGIKVNLTTMPYNSLEQKVFSEFAAHNSYYNVMISDTPWAPTLAKQFQPLLPYILNPKMTVSQALRWGDTQETQVMKQLGYLH